MIKEKFLKPRINCDKRGKITCGMKSVKNLPMSLDYFDISDFPELIKLYGDKPKELIVYCPTDDITDFFDCEFNIWTSTQQKIRKCDGETCTHLLAEKIGNKQYGQGEVTACICNELQENDKQKCHYYSYIKLYLAEPKTYKIINPMPILFQHRSINSGNNFYYELKKYKTLMNIPFLVSVKKVKKGSTSFPIMSIMPHMDIIGEQITQHLNIQNQLTQGDDWKLTDEELKLI